MRDYSSVVDHAREVLLMADRIYYLEQQLEHYKGMYEMMADAQNKEFQRNNEFFGDVLLKLLPEEAQHETHP